MLTRESVKDKLGVFYDRYGLELDDMVFEARVDDVFAVCNRFNVDELYTGDGGYGKVNLPKPLHPHFSDFTKSMDEAVWGSLTRSGDILFELMEKLNSFSTGVYVGPEDRICTGRGVYYLDDLVKAFQATGFEERKAIDAARDLENHLKRVDAAREVINVEAIKAKQYVLTQLGTPMDADSIRTEIVMYCANKDYAPTEEQVGAWVLEVKECKMTDMNTYKTDDTTIVKEEPTASPTPSDEPLSLDELVASLPDAEPKPKEEAPTPPVLSIPTPEELDAAVENITNILPKPDVVINDDLTIQGTLVLEDDEPVIKDENKVQVNIDTTTYRSPTPEKKAVKNKKKKESTFSSLFGSSSISF